MTGRGSSGDMTGRGSSGVHETEHTRKHVQ